MVERHGGLEAEDPAGLGFVCVGPGVWADPAFQTLLVRTGLGSLEAILGTRQGVCVRALADRENWRLELPDGEGGIRRVHLKKHRTRTWQRWLCWRLAMSPSPTPALREAANAAQLARNGIPVMRIVAYGWATRPGGWAESFVLSEHLEGYTELHQWVSRQVAVRSAGQRSPQVAGLIRAVAAAARRFHRAGYNHRDFYAGHWFVRPIETGGFDIRLIDLQRVQYRRRFRRRWIVKDLAQLGWSLPAEWVGCTQRMAFMRQYFGVAKLRPCHKRLIREVLAKQQLMERKLGPVAYPGLADHRPKPSETILSPTPSVGTRAEQAKD